MLDVGHAELNLAALDRQVVNEMYGSRDFGKSFVMQLQNVIEQFSDQSPFLSPVCRCGWLRQELAKKPSAKAFLGLRPRKQQICFCIQARRYM